MSIFDLSGKKAIITGASGGLGRGIAQGLHEAGAEIVIIDIMERVKATAEELSKTGPMVYSLIGNLADRKDLVRSFEDALKKLGGRVDILVNNAGIQRRSICEEFPLEYWDEVIEINLTAVFLLSQLAGKVMLNNTKGKIINMASMLSFFGGYTIPAYSASKGGVAQLTKALSNEWASRGVNVNAIAPGYMDTEMNTALISNKERNDKIISRIPAGRWGRPSDVAGLAVFLASDASDYISGAVIPVDGGYLGC